MFQQVQDGFWGEFGDIHARRRRRHVQKRKDYDGADWLFELEGYTRYAPVWGLQGRRPPPPARDDDNRPNQDADGNRINHNAANVPRYAPHDQHYAAHNQQGGPSGNRDRSSPPDPGFAPMWDDHHRFNPRPGTHTARVGNRGSNGEAARHTFYRPGGILPDYTAPIAPMGDNAQHPPGKTTVKAAGHFFLDEPDNDDESSRTQSDRSKLQNLLAAKQAAREAGQANQAAAQRQVRTGQGEPGSRRASTPNPDRVPLNSSIRSVSEPSPKTKRTTSGLQRRPLRGENELDREAAPEPEEGLREKNEDARRLSEGRQSAERESAQTRGVDREAVAAAAEARTRKKKGKGRAGKGKGNKK